MSTIVVFGVTGYAGGHITAELLDRGHAVIGVARDITSVAAREGLELRPGSLYDPAFRAEAVMGADAVAVALPAHPADGPDLETVVPGLLEAVAGARLGVVGGAASLQTADGRTPGAGHAAGGVQARGRGPRPRPGGIEAVRHHGRLVLPQPGRLVRILEPGREDRHLPRSAPTS